ncbi:MAG: hypothetical protein ABIZ49_12975 [Opitutaceae bacterium]
MEDDDDQPPKTYPLSPAKMSKVPSWISLGFVLGALAAWTFRPEGKPQPAPPVPRSQPELVAPKTPLPTKLTTVEAVFADWGRFAVWDGDTTEIVFWNAGTQDFTETYEVRRSGEALLFRSIARPTAPLIDYGARLPKECPLRFVDMEKYRAVAPPPPEKKALSVFAPPVGPSLKVERVQIVQPQPKLAIPTGLPGESSLVPPPVKR